MVVLALLALFLFLALLRPAQVLGLLGVAFVFGVGTFFLLLVGILVLGSLVPH